MLKILKGLPASGKSTRARELEQQGWIVISTDAIRQELTGDMENQDRNGEVFDLAFERAFAALRAGHKVVFDATNLRSAYRKEWLIRARDLMIPVEIEAINTPFLVCLWRNFRRKRRVPMKVLWRMWRHQD